MPDAGVDADRLAGDSTARSRRVRPPPMRTRGRRAAAGRASALRAARTRRSRVEQIGVLEDGAPAHVARVRAQRWIDTGGVEVGVGERLERLDAVADVAPELLEAGGAREASRHADDGDRVVAIGVSHRSVSRRAACARRSAPFGCGSRRWRAGSACAATVVHWNRSTSSSCRAELALADPACSFDRAAASGRRCRRSCRAVRRDRREARRARPRRRGAGPAS